MTTTPTTTDTAAAIDVAKVERAALLMHFDAVWHARILEGDTLSLSAAEKSLFAQVDRRAFQTDGERAARAVAVVVEELPVAVAVAGLPRVFAFFRDEALLDVIVGGVPLVVAVARFLGNAPARIEGAVARARRRRTAPAGEVVVAPHVASAPVPADAVDRWLAARASLGADVVAVVGGGRRVPWVDATFGDTVDTAGVLVTGTPSSPAVGRCAHALAALLARFEDGGSSEAFRVAARELGCDDDAEADALLADLVADGMVVRR
jgi:hypothetical protein